MKINRNGSLPTNKITGENFTGDVYISDYVAYAAPSRLVCATITCLPGARTSWKINPLGQTLIVLSGIGWAQGEGEDVVEIRAGDIVRCPPGLRHWEGATPTHAITYLVVQEALNGTAIETKEQVTDEEYFAAKK